MGGSPSRRRLLQSIGVLGLVTGASAQTAASDGDHLGETWEGDPAADFGLEINVTGDTTHALRAVSQADGATALFARASSADGWTKAIQGIANSSQGKGVFGYTPADSGPTIGVKGVSDSERGRGLYGYARAGSGWTRGVHGEVDSPDGAGVFGRATATSGSAAGVEGYTEAPGGAGVKGVAGSSDSLGLYTPDSAEVGGALRAGEGRTGRHPHADVTAHGAAGDGETNDTSAVRAARDAVGVGDVVFFPSGTYLVSESINRKGRAFVGKTPFNSVLKAESGGGPWGSGGRDIATAVTYDRGQNESICRRLGVDVNGEDAAGIASFGGERLRLVGNYVRGGADSGVQFWGNDVTGAQNCTDGLIAGNIVEGCEWNLVLDGACDACGVFWNASRAPTSRHVSVDNTQSADGRETVACAVESNICLGHSSPGAGPGAIQVRDSAGTGVGIRNNTVADWPANGIKAEDATEVSNNTVVGGSERLVRGVLLDGTRTGLLVEGNTVRGANVGYEMTSGTKPAVVRGNVGFDVGDPEELDTAFTRDWVIEGNYLFDGTSPDGSRLARTYAEGTATVPSGSTSTSWSYPVPLFAAPDPVDVTVTPTGPLGAAGHWWISDLTSEGLSINTDADPTRDATFALTVDIGQKG